MYAIRSYYAGYRTNETIFELESAPARLAILGAGPIGCEMAQAFARMGTQVTLIDREPRILPRDDADAAEVVARALASDGVRITSYNVCYTKLLRNCG